MEKSCLPLKDCRDLELETEEIHVWHALTEDFLSTRWMEAFETSLSRQELENKDRFLFPKDRHQYLIAHGLLRFLLSGYSGTAPSSWAFAANAHGKPHIIAPASLRGTCFNLSHTQGLVAFAVSRRAEVGVDAEFLDRPLSILPLARRFFSAAEVLQLETCPEEERKLMFFATWTLKEAYLKALGLGLFSLPLSSFSFCLHADGKVELQVSPDSGQPSSAWHFARSRPTSQHCLALAASASKPVPKVRWNKVLP